MGSEMCIRDRGGCLDAVAGQDAAQSGRGGDDRVALGGDKYCGGVLACAVLSIVR